MDSSLRQRVRSRAGDRCEYCQTHQDDEQFFRYHIEHIIPRKHGGSSVESNLALACHHCNLHKGPNLTGIDEESGQIIQLFNPRIQIWAEHFARSGAEIVGLTPFGRATVRVLAMNSASRLELRAACTKSA